MIGSDVMQGVTKAFETEAVHLEGLSKRRSVAHRAACNGWNTANYLLGTAAALAASGAGASAFSSDKALTATLALVGGAFAALAAFLNPSQHARLHQHAAASYAGLEGDFRRFRSIDLLIDSDVEKLRTELEGTITQFNSVDAASPPTPRLAARYRAKRHRHAAASAAPSSGA
jgi:hypothetical protein